MRQVNKTTGSLSLGLLHFRILWPILLLLALFVFFFEFIADVGGGAELTPPLPASPSPSASPTPIAGPFPDTSALPTASVIQIIDGDTLVVRLNGREFRLRYYGVDAPEPGERCFSEAKEANKQLAEGRSVRLLSSSGRSEEAGLLLRHVFLEDGRSVETLLISQGLVLASQNEGPYRDYFIALEEEAQAKRTGCLWSQRR